MRAQLLVVLLIFTAQTANTLEPSMAKFVI